MPSQSSSSSYHHSLKQEQQSGIRRVSRLLLLLMVFSSVLLLSFLPKSRILPTTAHAWYLPAKVSHYHHNHHHHHIVSKNPRHHRAFMALPNSNDNLAPPKEASTTKRIVVVGGGLGGLSSAYDAKHLLMSSSSSNRNNNNNNNININDVEITVVSDRKDFQFHPSNPWIATRQRQPQDISLSLTEILPRHGIHFVHAAVTHLDPQKQTLQLSEGEALEYDFLIIATGPHLAFEEIPGTGPGHFTASVCTTPHASETAQAVDALVEQPGPVVIGAVQGASCFGPAYEFALLLHHELGKRGGTQLQEQCPITFVTSEPYIGHLGLNGAGESQAILERLFRKKGIQWYTNCQVQKVTKESVLIEYLEEIMGDDGKSSQKHQQTIPSRFNMLIPAFRGMQVWKSVPGLTDPNGMIHVNEYQQSVKYPHIFAVGIAVHLDSVEPSTPIPTGTPKTGYMIESMGTAAVKNIQTMLQHQTQKHSDKDAPDDDAPPELHTKALLNGLCITDFGQEGAIFLTLPQLPPRKVDLTMDGKIATLAKIAFEKYFLHKIESGDTDPYYEKYMLHLIGVDRTTTSPPTK